jgi:uncharacterized membrane protein YeaQ/YmgE (transglycosylase-associated protein family)
VEAGQTGDEQIHTRLRDVVQIMAGLVGGWVASSIANKHVGNFWSILVFVVAYLIFGKVARFLLDL